MVGPAVKKTGFPGVFPLEPPRQHPHLYNVTVTIAAGWEVIHNPFTADLPAGGH